MVDKSHPIIKKIEHELNKLNPDAIIVDVGTSNRFAKEVKYFESTLQQHHYFSLGYKTTSCDLDGDIHKLPLKDGSVDVLICFEVIEHVQDPFKAVQELFRVLHPGGLLLLTTPFLFPYHGRSSTLINYSHEEYPDFWRFTHQGLRFLCKDFSKVEVYAFSSTIGYYAHLFLSIIKLHGLHKYLDRLFFSETQARGQATYRHLVRAKK
jgi:ubiquinone/menaquinone biosynthesis C-methylase UbiE